MLAMIRNRNKKTTFDEGVFSIRHFDLWGKKKSSSADSVKVLKHVFSYLFNKFKLLFVSKKKKNQMFQLEDNTTGIVYDFFSFFIKRHESTFFCTIL